MGMMNGARRDEILPGPNSSAEGQGGEGSRQPIHSLPPPYGHKRWGGLFPRVGGAVSGFLAGELVAALFLLFGVTVGMLWANTAPHAYETFWQTPLTMTVGTRSFGASLHHLVNDGLMTLFFLLTGLEMRRESVAGELSSARKALLPVAAALGGMLVPAVICWLLIRGAPTALGRAWAVPMATDIAFAVAVLLALGRRVFPAMRVFLLTLAVADDIGAVLILGVVFSQGVSVGGLVYVFGAILWMWAVRAGGGRRLGWYFVIPLPLAWWGFHLMGIHPVLSGVLIALFVPVQGSPEGAQGFRSVVLDESHSSGGHDAGPDAVLTEVFDSASAGYLAGVSPLRRAMNALQPIVSTGVVFLFALANAGVSFGGLHAEPGTGWVAAGIALGLVIGKPVGIWLASEAMIRTGLCVRPVGMSPSVILVVGMIAGIGFTVANFTAQLALPFPAVLAVVKVVITIASVTAGLLGLALGKRWLSEVLPEGAARTDAEAESSEAV
ncbi:Na+/H+ antiporter NhaA [Patescibacteria group bacterium]|nr:Na+/H+ antiporter NhaA [Patescibacteria group bacterium]MDQ5919568.1 Na+:H+ antiporter, NhaA family [Patescibacteria group bacterium]